MVTWWNTCCVGVLCLTSWETLKLKLEAEALLPELVQKGLPPLVRLISTCDIGTERQSDAAFRCSKRLIKARC